MSFGRPDVTGRSSGKLTGRAGKLRRPAKGEPWVWLTRELLTSEAWRALGVNSRRLIDFLLIEHMNHSGTENGHLIATYTQLAEVKLSRRLIHDAVRECVFFGLLRVDHGGKAHGNVRRPNRYLLTFYADKEGSPATNQWKAITAKRVEDWKEGRTRMRAALAVSKAEKHKEDIEAVHEMGA